MGDYYSRAKCVLSWLGIGTKLEYAALDHMKHLRCLSRDSPQRREPMGLDLLHGYLSVISKTYFKRLWVVQELARAEKAGLVLEADDGKIIVVDMTSFNVSFQVVRTETTITSKTIAEVQKEIRLRLQIQEHTVMRDLMGIQCKLHEPDIFELIEAFCHFRCADPKDKLYALRDVVHLKQQLFDIDYGKNVYQISAGFLAACLNQGGRDGKLSVRQADNLAKLAMEMEVDIETLCVIQVAPEGGGNTAPSSSRCLRENFELLLQSLSYMSQEDVRHFGPLYDNKTGDHPAPSLEAPLRQYGIAAPFKILRSVDIDSVLKTQGEKLAQEFNVNLSTSSVFGQADAAKNHIDTGDETTTTEDCSSDEYRDYWIVLANVGYSQLPALDCDSESKTYILPAEDVQKSSSLPTLRATQTSSR